MKFNHFFLKKPAALIYIVLFSLNIINLSLCWRVNSENNRSDNNDRKSINFNNYREVQDIQKKDSFSSFLEEKIKANRVTRLNKKNGKKIKKSKKSKRKSKIKKTNSKMKAFDDDVKVGIESELNLFVEEYATTDGSVVKYEQFQTDLESSCDLKDNLISHIVSKCIKDGSKILFGFKNEYPGAIGFDVQKESNAYEFRTVGGLSYDQLVNQVSKFKNWVLPIYQSFSKSTLPTKDTPYFDHIVNTDKFKMKMTSDFERLLISNQATISCKFENLISNIQKIMKNLGSFLLPVAIYSGMNQLTLFKDNEWGKYEKDIDKDWYNNSYNYLLKQNEKISEDEIKNLNPKQKLLAYFILSCFKVSQFQDDSSRINKDRKKWVKGLGNNFLKGLLPFLPKVAEHFWGLTEDDLKHKIFAKLETEDLKLPYEFQYSTTKVEKLYYSAKDYLIALKYYIVNKKLDKAISKDCSHEKSFLDCDLRQSKKYKYCYDFELKTVDCEFELYIPGSFFKDENIVIEIRSIKNTAFSQNLQGKEAENLSDDYEKIFINLFNALKK